MSLTPLSDIRNSLVRSWGEMSGYWGINRTMAEIHALLFISTEPLCTDDVMDQLQISRGNASMNLRGLVDWGLIRRFHRLGDRKEYFQADTDVWHMFETIMRERRRREVEPIVATIDRCMETLRRIHAERPSGAGSAAQVRNGGDGAATNSPPLPDPAVLAESRRRLENLRDFLATVGGLFDLVLRFGPQTMQQVAKMYSGMLAKPESAPSLRFEAALEDGSPVVAPANRKPRTAVPKPHTERPPATTTGNKARSTGRRNADAPRKRTIPSTRSQHDRSRTR